MSKRKALRFGGHIVLAPDGRSVRSIPIASYHHPERNCWLWYACLRRCVADEKRAFRYFRQPGHQDRRVWQFWAWSIDFVWQEAGRFKDYPSQRRHKLSRLFNVDFEEPPQWPQPPRPHLRGKERRDDGN